MGRGCSAVERRTGSVVDMTGGNVRRGISVIS